MIRTLRVPGGRWEAVGENMTQPSKYLAFIEHVVTSPDRRTQARFTGIARLAARSVGAPVVQVNVIHEDRQVSLCSIGSPEWLGPIEVGLDHSICQYVVASGQPQTIPDTTASSLTSGNGLTVDRGIRSYLGVPIRLDGAGAVATLCALDVEPRQWTAEEIATMEDLAHYLEADFEEIAESRTALRESEARYDTLFEQSRTGILTYSSELRVLQANPRAGAPFLLTREQLMDADLNGIRSTEMLHAFRTALAGKEGEYLGPYTAHSTGAEAWIELRTSPLRDAAGRIVGGIATIEDLTEGTHTRAELQQARFELLERLAQAAEFRDDDTGLHTRRVGDLAARIALALDLPVDEVDLIRRTAPLHDVGKIAIPDSILLKPGKLTVEEFEVMKTHTTVGAQILSGSSSELVTTAAEIALSHHERWDGDGYPAGLAGEEIPLTARIVAVADFYDALTHDRVYRSAWDRGRVVAAIEERSGSHFDPRVAQAFLGIADDIDPRD